MENLSESNFLVHAMHNYDVPTCLDLEEFNTDLKRLGFINRGLKSKEINIQLILNHLIILYNVFGNFTTKMVLFKIENKYWPYIIPCLIYLNRLNDEMLTGCLLKSGPLDQDIIEKLRNL